VCQAVVKQGERCNGRQDQFAGVQEYKIVHGLLFVFPEPMGACNSACTRLRRTYPFHPTMGLMWKPS
jgi:hypothetical protein